MLLLKNFRDLTAVSDDDARAVVLCNNTKPKVRRGRTSAGRLGRGASASMSDIENDAGATDGS
jgi:hypothetical protein